METTEFIELKLKTLIDTIHDDPKYRIVVQRHPDYGFQANITSPDSVFLGAMIGVKGENLNSFRRLVKIIEQKHKFNVLIWVERFATNS